MSYPLLTITRPFSDVDLVEIFKPYETYNTIAYPVTVDGLKTTIESTGIHTWTAKGFGLALSQKLIDYIGGEIEHFEL